MSNWNTNPLEPTAFDEYRAQAYEFRWVRNPHTDEMVYQKCPVKKVVGVRSTGVKTRAGSGSATKGLAALSFTCPVCSKTHSPLVGC